MGSPVLAELPDDEGIIWRPILAGLASLKEAKDGTYSLEDFRWMNNALNVQTENERRWNEYYKSIQSQGVRA
ncbi:hypothetical protein FACS1894216_01200 [Synergistales bacterium]|nr:hypothetical protein FACS1894216_01200 [Synergistales bacterium]